MTPRRVSAVLRSRGAKFERDCQNIEYQRVFLACMLLIVIGQIPQGTAEQHRAFVEIVDQFITTTSPAQVNLESGMRTHIMALRPR